MSRAFALAGLIAASLLVSTQTRASSLSDGLVAHYQLDGNANDSSGLGNNGTLVGAGAAADRFGSSARALNFTNSTNVLIPAANYVTIPDAPALRPTGEFTIAAWIRTTDVTSIRPSILAKQVGSGTFGSYVLWLQTPVAGQSGVLRLATYDGSSETIIGSTPIPLNEWHHVAGTWDGANLHLFLDGAEVATAPFAGPVAYDANPVIIGADDNDTDNVPDSGWNGRIDDARIYNRALLPAEVAALQAARLILPLAPTTDVSGLSNDGALTGAVATADRFGTPSAALNFLNPLDFTAPATDFISMPDHASLRPATALTVGAWIKPGINSIGHIVAKQLGSGNFNSYVLWIQDALRFALCNNVDGCVEVFVATPTVGEWHHAAGTWDGAVITLYLDGSPVATTPFAGPVDYDSNPLFIGADENNDANDLPDRGFNGDIDDVQIFARSLSGCDLNVVASIGPPCVTCVDQDADGYGNPGDATCSAGPATDCDDGNASVSPGGSEVPGNGVDDDCNPATSDCNDFDLDGYGNPASVGCAHPQLDCNDSNANINPGKTEIPSNGIDDDCNPATPGGCQPQLAEASVGTASPRSSVDLGLYLVPGYALVALFRRSMRKRVRG